MGLNEGPGTDVAQTNHAVKRRANLTIAQGCFYHRKARFRGSVGGPQLVDARLRNVLRSQQPICALQLIGHVRQHRLLLAQLRFLAVTIQLDEQAASLHFLAFFKMDRDDPAGDGRDQFYRLSRERRPHRFDGIADDTRLRFGNGDRHSACRDGRLLLRGWLPECLPCKVSASGDYRDGKQLNHASLHCHLVPSAHRKHAEVQSHPRRWKQRHSPSFEVLYAPRAAKYPQTILSADTSASGILALETWARGRQTVGAAARVGPCGEIHRSLARGMPMRVLAYVIALGFTALLALPAAADVPRPPPAKPEQSLVQQSNLTLPAAREVQGPRADYILVNKSERYLKLFSDGEEIAHFPIQLGKQPIGHKLYEGDNRTPEGVYYIDWRNPESHYFRSLRISYPNSEDRAQAEAAGLDPGGMIMIHGMPNNVDYRLEVQDQKDWTNGCIALSDGDMLAVWDMVDVGTAIEILP